MPSRPSIPPKRLKPGAPGVVQVWVGARPRRLGRWLGLLLAIVGLGGGLGLLGLSFRLGLRLMLNPEALPQVLARLQRSQQAPLPPATSLADLRRQAAAAHQQVGEPQRLDGAEDGAGVVVVPVLAADSGAIAALNLFQREGAGESLRAIATLTIPPLPKDTILRPWLNSPQAPTAAPPTFSFTRLVPLPPPVATGGVWLTLEGNWRQQGLTLRYGQLLHYDPQARRLDLLEPWSSPSNRLPQWADLDGEGPSDLVVDETVGLEPTLRGWQVGAGSPPRLQSVSWVAVPVDAGARAGAYQKALRSARSGLWHAAELALADLKPALSAAWTPAAEAQLRLAKRHAAITRQQADQDWSTPAQRILALLIDGRWEAALVELEADPALLPTLLNRLGTDRGLMWNRIRAAAALSDPDPAVYVWAGLTLKAQQNQPARLNGATQDWLSRQPVPAATRQRLAAVLASLTTIQNQTVASTKAAATAAIAPAAGAATPAIAPLDAIIGQARPISPPQDGYAAPGQVLDASLGQWYAVELRAIHQNQAWQPGHFSVPPGVDPAAAWPLVRPAAQASPQLLRWVSPTTGLPAPLTVRGLTLTNGAATLLATGPAVNPSALRPLVFSQGALTWLDANQRQPPDTAVVLPPLAAALFGDRPPPADFADTVGDLAQYSLDLTGDGQPERVLTWEQPALDQLTRWRVPIDPTAPKTVILSPDNQVIYSDLLIAQTLVALTNPALGGPVNLLVYRAEGYDLLTWNPNTRQFK
ncbi:hypothetical protein [Nodosilinea nodulosa]|uniref:hypothetical protein n=1 Tax=Nodosilinea nodulosa TaxID=416001 RepID=UPI00037D2B9C|nr:hypothetical protein [Nodosilinea nodulosa]